MKSERDLTAARIAEKVGGELKTDPGLTINRLKGAAAVDEDCLTYVQNRDYMEMAREAEAGLVLIQPELYRELEEKPPAILVDNPRLAYAKAYELMPDDRYNQPGIAGDASVDSRFEAGEEVSVHPGAVIRGPVKIGSGSRIAPGCLLVGDLELGEDCLLHPGVRVIGEVIIGDRVEIQSGAVIGSDGFGYASGDKKHYPLPQQGRVIIEDDVEIGALTAVDRAAEEETRIGAGSKIDNLVQISHNVKIGPATLIAGQSGIAGSSTLGQSCTLAGQVGVEDHLEIGDDITLTGKAKVSKDLKGPGIYSGIPVQNHREYLKLEAHLRRVPSLREKVEKLSSEVEELKNTLAEYKRD